MKYIVFLFAIIAAAQSAMPPVSVPVKRQPCSATVTDNCTPQTVGGTTYGVAGGSGTGDVLGAAAVQSGRVPYGSGTTGTLTGSSKFSYNDTTGMGLIPPLSLGQNGTAAGRINLLGSTSGSYPIEVNADGTSITFTGGAVFTGPITAGASGPLDLTAIAAPSTPAAGIGSLYVDSTSKNIAIKNDAGTVNHGVQTKAAASNQVLRAIADDGTVTQSALASADIPNNAANTTGTAASITGNLTGDVTSTAMTTTLAAKHKTRIGSATIFDPVTGDSGRVQIMFPYAVTITSISCSVKAATSATINLDERAFATPDTAGTAVLTSALACDTDGATSTTFTNATIAANVPMALLVTAVSGTPDTLRVFWTYTID